MRCSRPGELLDGVPDLPVFKVFRDVSRAKSFTAPPNVLSMQSTKIPVMAFTAI